MEVDLGAKSGGGGGSVVGGMVGGVERLKLAAAVYWTFCRVCATGVRVQRPRPWNATLLSTAAFHVIFMTLYLNGVVKNAHPGL